MKSYKDLDVYKRSYKLALNIHKISLLLPKTYQHNLVDQIRRASHSVPANIAEAYGRNKSGRDIISQLRTALGSNDEVLFNLNFLKDADLIKDTDFKEFSSDCEICGKQLTNLIKSINQKLATSY